MPERKEYRPIDEVLSELRMTPLQFIAVAADEGSGYLLAGNASYFQDKTFKFGEGGPEPLFTLNQDSTLFEASLDKLFSKEQGQLRYIVKDAEGKRDVEALVNLVDSIFREVGNNSLETSMYIIPLQLKKLDTLSGADRENLLGTIQGKVDQMKREEIKLSRFLKIYSLLRELVLQSTDILDSDQFESTDESEWEKSEKPLNERLSLMDMAESRSQATLKKAREFLASDEIRQIVG